MLERGQGYRTALVTCTRGNGGQNEIGPELFEALGVLRTEELASRARFDGAEQYFTRAVDFGYLVQHRGDVREVGARRDRPRLRPHHAHGAARRHRHDAAGRRGWRAAPPGPGADHRRGIPAGRPTRRSSPSSSRRPAAVAAAEALLHGALRLPRRAGAGGRGAARSRSSNDVYDPLLGQTYVEIGGEARSKHKCQGMGQLLPLPGPQSMQYRLGDSVASRRRRCARTRSLFDGVDTTHSRASRSSLRAQAPKALDERPGGHRAAAGGDRAEGVCDRRAKRR